MGPTRSVARRTAVWLIVMLIVLTAGSAAAPATSAAGPVSYSVSAEDEPRIRKNVKSLTADERRDFVEAVLTLKTVPSPFDAEMNYYDQFVAWHLSLYPCGLGHAMIRPHGGPMFLPWHRIFLLRFEDALREVSGKPITVPYWDWADPASTHAVFADDFMGGDGDPNEGFAVTSGPFRKGAWTLNVHPLGVQYTASASPHITRRFGSLPAFGTLPTPEDISFLLGRPRYDVAPYDATSNPNVSFRNALEGFWLKVGSARIPVGTMVCGPDGIMITATGPGVHNLAHAWVGGLLGVTVQGPRVGTMLLPTSPNDPVFFLHHANIDRLWAEWQEVHGVDTYEPATCDGLLKLGCRANTRTDPMHPPFEATPDDVADARALGYRYESMAAESAVTPGSAVLTEPTAAGLLFRCEIRKRLI